MRYSFALIMCIFFTSGWTQNSDSLKPARTSLTWSGFIHADAIYDSRQVTEAREGFLLLYPKNIQRDKTGEDINAKGSFNQYAMSGRITARLTGPDVLGAKVTGLMEGDFTGASNSENNSFRLRHAWAKLSWSKTTLLAGQFWHPMDVPEMLPSVLSLNTGAPFHSFSRQPQVRFEISPLKSIRFVLAATAQRDYVNHGPAGSSSIYLRNSGMPNFHAQLQFQENKLFAGFGFDYKELVPRLVTDSNYKADEKVPSLALLAFLKLETKKIVFKAQASYGQNLNDHLMLGGYGVATTDPLSGKRTYSSLNYLNTWMNITTTGKKLQYSVFAGFSKGFGAGEKITGPVYARDPDIAYTYRVAPMITYYTGKLGFSFESEMTAAAYGKTDEYYKVTAENTLTNFRNTLSLIYTF